MESSLHFSRCSGAIFRAGRRNSNATLPNRNGMRIAFLNSSRWREGGREVYLHTVMPALTRLGHEVSLCYETDFDCDREPIELPQDAPAWCLSQLGVERTLRAVREWRPDVIYSQDLGDIE